MTTLEPSATSRILVVDDDEDTRLNLRDILELDGYEVAIAGCASEIFASAPWADLSLVLLDRKLPDGTPQTLLPRIQELAPHVSVVIVTGYADIEGAILALRSGAADYILKPVSADALRASIARLLARQRAEREVARLQRVVDDRQSELDTLLNVFPSDIAIAIAQDRDCKFVHVNDCLARILGIPRHMNASSSVSVPDRPEFVVRAEGRNLTPQEMPLQQAADRGIAIRDAEIQVICESGDATDLLGYVAPLFDRAGQTRGAVGVFLDITERKRAAARLRESEQRYRGLFENAQDGFLVLDESQRIVDANPAACDKLEFALDDLRHRRLDELIVAAEGAPGIMAGEIFASPSHRGECRLATRSGRMLDIEFRAVAGVLPGLHLLSIHDITERKRAEERARQAQRLAAIGETMTALVHESRNALQRSRACLEMLALEVEDRPEAMDLVQRAQRAQHDLHQLYEEVRQWAAPLQLRPEECDVAALWRDVWRQIVESRETPTRSLREEIASDTHCPIDRFLMAQVFRNIFENAWDVSPASGTVFVRCWTTMAGGMEQLRISIADQGPGLTAEQQVRIFEPFFTTKSKGTGLGMAIVQRIVHSHGGTIEASSPGGAQIEIILPRGRT